MITWEEFYNNLKKNVEYILRDKEINESNLQFDKIIGDTIKEMFIKENIIKRKQLPYNKREKKPGKYVLYEKKEIKNDITT